MKHDDFIIEQFQESISVISESKKLSALIIDSATKIINCFTNGKKVITFGNGGSAADAQHLAAEFVCRYKIERQSLPAISLTTDSSIITAIGNDYGFEHIFEKQCESIVGKDDVVVAISTSGTSKNIINGILTCKKKGAFIIGLTGGEGGDLKKLADIILTVPSNSTPRIQEVHRIIMHIICELVDEFFKSPSIEYKNIENDALGE